MVSNIFSRKLVSNYIIQLILGNKYKNILKLHSRSNTLYHIVIYSH